MTPSNTRKIDNDSRLHLAKERLQKRLNLQVTWTPTIKYNYPEPFEKTDETNSVLVVY